MTENSEEILERAIGAAVRSRRDDVEGMILTWIVGVAYRTPEDYTDETTRYAFFSPAADAVHTKIGMATKMTDFYRGRD